MSDLIQASLAEIRTRLAGGDVSAEAVAKACLDRIAETEPSIHALITVREQALEEARALDAQGPDASKPLWGVPVTVKDAIVTKGTRTTAGSKILGGFNPFYDAFVVERLKEAGAVIVGKNNMDEFAMGSSTENSAFGPTRNPRDPERIPGGSSGGSRRQRRREPAAMPPSVRTPAAPSASPQPCAAAWASNPTYGRVSRYGVIAYGSSLDQVGPLARTVEDAALVLSVIAGHDKRDSTSSPRPVDNYADFSRTDLKGVRLGVPREFMAEGLDGPVAKACQDALDRARDLGAELVDVSLPHATRHAIAAYYIVAMAEASSNLSRFDGVRYGYRAADPKNLDDLYCRSRSEGFGQEVQRRILLGTYVLSAGYYDAYYKKAAQIRRLIRQDYLNALGSCDALFGPVSPVTAWKLGSIIDDPLKMYLMDIYTVSLNLAGLPGLSFPVGEADGLPVGMQLIGRDFDEAGILGIGNVLSK